MLALMLPPSSQQNVPSDTVKYCAVIIYQALKKLEDDRLTKIISEATTFLIAYGAVSTITYNVGINYFTGDSQLSQTDKA